MGYQRVCPYCEALNGGSAVYCQNCKKLIVLFTVKAPRPKISKRIRKPRPARLPNNCAYCGGECNGYTCEGHSDLPRLEALLLCEQ